MRSTAQRRARAKHTGRGVGLADRVCGGYGVQKKLSTEQKAILLWLLEQYETGNVDPRHSAWGVPWRTSGTASARAVLSRSISRLEARGLVLRNNRSRGTEGPLRADPSGELTTNWGVRPDKSIPNPKRTTHVSLTTEGLKIAQSLKTANINADATC